MPVFESPQRGPLGNTQSDDAKIVPIVKTGAVAAATYGTQFRFYNDTDYALTLYAVRCNLGTAGSTTTTVDVLKNGTSVWSVTPANRPSLTSGLLTAVGGAIDAPSVAAGQYLDVAVTAAGTSASDMTVWLYLAS